MSDPIPVSVIVVSRGRPKALTRCLTGLAQLLHPAFEIVVVADPAGIAAIADRGGRIKTVGFDEPNISAARNLGVVQAAGEIVAFIDDDAVPEPTWLTRLTAPFAAPQVVAAGGYVLGRNGISLQWPPRAVGGDGSHSTLALDGTAPALFTGTSQRGIRTEGTNMAFRRDTLAAMGGFDPVFRFYLDETDLNLRLGAVGAVTAIVPLAQVHHGFAASARRRADRVPQSLYQVGASLAAFARKHGTGDPTPVLAAELAARRAGLIGHMIAGRIEPRDVQPLLSSLQQGWAEGLARALTPLPPLPAPVTPFLPFRPPVADRGARVLAGRRWQARSLRAQASALAAQGWRISLYLFFISAQYHRVRFDPSGFWEQSGGLFGKSVRRGRAVRPWRFDNRLQSEVARVALQRGIGEKSTQV